MPKGGSGFLRAAGSAAKATLGRGGSSGWALVNQGRGVKAIQSLYAQTYRNDDVVFQFDSRGRVSDINISDRFVTRAERLSEQLAREVRIRDAEADREYRELRSWARRIKTTEAERREFKDTYQRESHLSMRPGRNAGDAAEVARQMAGLGLISHDIPAMHNNVDILTAINDAVNSAKGRIWSDIGQHGAGAAADFQADIFEGITSRYAGVVRDAMKRRR